MEVSPDDSLTIPAGIVNSVTGNRWSLVCVNTIIYLASSEIGNFFYKPIDKLGKLAYTLVIESEQAKERSGMQCLKPILMSQSGAVVECVSPGHIRMAGCIRMLLAAPET